ncbi:ABC transporter substrate-binding protein [Olsenella phocaeensis]|uniref:ABC transporter substrate-binding protein n=1 Tax=Olsenella phocaeensis TaxID=1852385 RepID=UPI003A91DCCF
MHKRKLFPLASFVVVLLALALVGCAGAPWQGQNATGSQGVTEVRVGSLKGPTSIGLASFMDRAAGGGTANAYSFTIASSADEIVPSVVSGDLDVALVPANVASVLYNKTKGAVSVIDVNTLGVLSVVTGDEGVSSLADLAGRTVYMTGKGTTPEFVMQYLLQKSELADKVTLEFKSAPTEVVAALVADPSAVGVLPQPYVTAATSKNPSLRAAIDLNDAWAATGEGATMVTGVTVVRNDFLRDHPAAVEEFLKEHAASVDAANSDPAGVSPKVVAAGIMDNEKVVEKAIPACHLVCLTGSEMEGALSGYLGAIASVDASSVGGSLPPKDFYFQG